LPPPTIPPGLIKAKIFENPAPNFAIGSLYGILFQILYSSLEEFGCRDKFLICFSQEAQL